MVNYIIEFKWVILISSEVMFWLTFIIFLLLRYWFESRGQFIFLYLSIANQFLNIPLAAIDYIYTGQTSAFHFVILIIYIYAILRGPKDMQKLDMYIRNKVLQWKKKRLNRRTASPFPSASFLDSYPKLLRIKIGLHLCLFLGFQLIISTTPHNLVIDRLSSFWTMVVIIDGIWSLTLSFAQKKSE